MSLVNVKTGEVVADISAEDARTLTDRIKVTVESAWQMVKQAYEVRAWAVLGYDTWDDYCTREFGTSRLKLPREERQEVVASLRDSGLSTRAIAAATGLDRKTVRKEIEVGEKGPPATPPTREPTGEEVAAGHMLYGPEAFLAKQGGQEPPPLPASAPPPKIIGTDGKRYDVTPQPKAKDRRPPLTDAAQRAGWEFRKSVERLERVAVDDRFTANKEQVAAHWRGHLSYAVEVCQDLLNRLDHQS